MLADEKFRSAGTEVVYTCRNDNCKMYKESGGRYREKVEKFFDNRK